MVRALRVGGRAAYTRNGLSTTCTPYHRCLLDLGRWLENGGYLAAPDRQCLLRMTQAGIGLWVRNGSQITQARHVWCFTASF